jgi:hypothetical protein
MFYIGFEAIGYWIMHYIYNKNVIEIEGRNWNSISPNQFDKWCGVVFELSLLAFNMKNGHFGGVGIFVF